MKLILKLLFGAITVLVVWAIIILSQFSYDGLFKKNEIGEVEIPKKLIPTVCHFHDQASSGSSLARYELFEFLQEAMPNQLQQIPSGATLSVQFKTHKPVIIWMVRR